MDKMERFLLKGPGKLDMVVGAIVCLALFFAYRIGLGIDAGWTYILLLFLAVLILIVFAKDKEVFIKVCAIITTFVFSDKASSNCVTSILYCGIVTSTNTGTAPY